MQNREMDRQQILEYIYDTKLIERIASSYVTKLADFKEDFVQYIWLLVCEIPETKLKELYINKQLNFYIYGIAKNQAWNDKSTFYQIYNEKLNFVYGEIEKIVANEDR